jgi:hypothetical protein
MPIVELQLPGAATSGDIGSQVEIDICDELSWVTIGNVGSTSIILGVSDRRGVNGPLFETGVVGGTVPPRLWQGFWSSGKMYLQQAFQTNPVRISVLVQPLGLGACNGGTNGRTTG